jgi:hypothetical protein
LKMENIDLLPSPRLSAPVFLTPNIMTRDIGFSRLLKMRVDGDCSIHSPTDVLSICPHSNL